MVKKEVILCDKYKKTVAGTKCRLCEIDLCSGCARKVSLEIGGVYNDGSGSFGYYKFYFCDEYHKKLGKNNPNENLLDKEFLSKLSDEIVKHLKKKLIIDNLE